MKTKKFLSWEYFRHFFICIQHIYMNFNSLNFCCVPQISIISTLKYILIFLCFDIKCIYRSEDLHCYRELHTVIQKKKKILLEIIGWSCGVVLLIAKWFVYSSIIFLKCLLKLISCGFPFSHFPEFLWQYASKECKGCIGKRCKDRDPLPKTREKSACFPPEWYVPPSRQQQNFKTLKL